MYLEEGMQYERSEGTKPAFSFESFEFSLLQLPVRMKVCKEELHFSWVCQCPSWGNGSVFDTLTLPSITCWPCSILQVGQPFGMSQNLGGNLSPFSKVSCFPGCWMAGTLCGRVPDTSGPACENCRLGMLLIEKTMLPEQLRYFFHLFSHPAWFSSAVTDIVLMTCLPSSEIPMKSPYLQTRELKCIRVGSSVWNFLVRCFTPLIFSLVWSCLNLRLYALVRCFCWGPKA